jgi:metallo-beta-lactamase family protein
MNLSFHGAAQTVTGSRHLISINGSRVLLDCGLFQGRRQETLDRNRHFSFDPKRVDAVILSHAHIDHCGNLPSLVAQGFEGPIHTTHATRHLTEILLQDAAHIQESDAEFLNKRLARRGEPLIRPLYTTRQAAAAAERLVSHEYEGPFEPVPGVHATFVDAGHILGSAGIILQLEERGRVVRLMFSGDIGRPGLPIIRDPVLPPSDIDVLLMECTYGDIVHPAPAQAYLDLAKVVRRTIDRGGKVIIPAFAVGRTQGLVFDLHQLIKAREIPRVPIFVDSPLAVNVSEVFQEHPEFFDDAARALIRSDPGHDPMGFDLLTYTRSADESKALNERKDPIIIISASGMAESGRILHHLRHNIEEPRNTILITSWMAPHTLGRRLVERQPVVRVFGEEFPLRAEVAVINGLSAHAGQDFLVEYARAVRGQAQRIYLVHGEPEPAAALKAKLGEAGLKGVDYPPHGHRAEL